MVIFWLKQKLRPTLYVYLFMYIFQPLHMSKMWQKVHFPAEFNRFEFRVFLLQDWLSNQG